MSGIGRGGKEGAMLHEVVREGLRQAEASGK